MELRKILILVSIILGVSAAIAGTAYFIVNLLNRKKSVAQCFSCDFSGDGTE